jgi:hypothetical protein
MRTPDGPIPDLYPFALREEVRAFTNQLKDFAVLATIIVSGLVGFVALLFLAITLAGFLEGID